MGWSFPSGQQITQLWGGVVNDDGPAVSVSNASYNRAVPAEASTNFGFIGSYSGGNAAPAQPTCTSP